MSANDIVVQDGQKIQAAQNIYMEATQDGVVRLLFNETGPNIVGLYTEGLQTCLAIIMVGDRGISLIHSAGMLSPESIQNELKLIGNIEFWTVGYNPTFYPKKREDSDLRDKLADIIIAIEEIAKNSHLKEKNGSGKLYETLSGFLSIDRKKHIQLDQKPNILKRPIDFDERYIINRCNNFFLLKEERIPVDIQFDGHTQLQRPLLFKKPEEIEAICEIDIFKKSLYTIREKESYYLAYKNQRNRIVIKYRENRDGWSMPTLEMALRRATFKGEKNDVRLLLEYGAKIDDPDPKFNRTALHIAKLRQHAEIAELLISHGANTHLKDCKGKIPSDYNSYIQPILEANSFSSFKLG